MSQIGLPIRESFFPKRERRDTDKSINIPEKKEPSLPNEEPIYVPNWPVRIKRTVENE